MNLAAASIGFDNMSSQAFEKTMMKEMSDISRMLIEKVPKEQMPRYLVEGSERYHRDYVTIYTGRYTGITGLWLTTEDASEDTGNGGFVPFVDGQVLNVLPMDHIVVERLVRDESYVVDVGQVTSGVTLVFSLQNPGDYLGLMEEMERLPGETRKFDVNARSDLGDMELQAVGNAVSLGALALKGRILLPMSKERQEEYPYFPPFHQVRRPLEPDASQSQILDQLGARAEQSDRVYDRQLALARCAGKRMNNGENLYSIVDTMFMPCGAECDLYSVLGEIEEVLEDRNRITGTELWILLLNCNGIRLTLTIPKKNCEGVPAKGRRFEGDIWLRGKVHLLPAVEDE
ncbi:MAG: DUF3881 family protein [Lachnospira sp.]|nr:DUF3881 family protein [Lachnospira sp.]